MSQGKKITDPIDQRQYLRLKTVIPVEFTIVRLQGDLPGFDWEKGHTRNVSRGGLCLESTRLKEATIKFLNKENIYLEIKIYLPGLSDPLKAVGEVAWHQKKADKPGQFIIGLKYRSIVPAHLKRILTYARQKNRKKQTGFALFVIFSLLFFPA